MLYLALLEIQSPNILIRIRQYYKSWKSILNFFKKRINSYLVENNMDVRVYRFQTILRIVFSKEQIKSRISRDFFEKKI